MLSPSLGSGISFQMGENSGGGYRVEWLGMETEYSSPRLGMQEEGLLAI